MSESRLGGLRKGYENADTFNRIVAHTKDQLPTRFNLETREGRGESLDTLYKERRIGSMVNVIQNATGGFMTDQELKDATFLLNRAL